MNLFKRKERKRPIYVNEVKVELNPEDFIHFDKRRNYILKIPRPISPQYVETILKQCKEKGFKVEIAVLEGDIQMVEVRQ